MAGRVEIMIRAEFKELFLVTCVLMSVTSVE